jgi:hypothetical protein
MDSPRRRAGDDEGGEKAINAAFADSRNPNLPQSAVDDIRVFRPGDSDATLALRSRLQTAQIFASARAVRSESDTARTILWMVADVATGWTFAPTDDETLKDIADALRFMVRAATVFERAELTGCTGRTESPDA